MVLPDRLQEELARVKSTRAESQIAIFERHRKDALALALASETLMNTIRIIELREPAGTVEPGSMRRAFNRRYGAWKDFPRTARAIAGAEEDAVLAAPREPLPSKPQSDEVAARTPSPPISTPGGIRDERGTGRVWGDTSND